MPKLPVDECPAGPWLDAAVAEAEGLHEEIGWWVDDTGQIIYPACIGCDGIPTWHPSGNRQDAIGLVDKMRQSFVYGPNFFEMCDDMVPLTITRAFLKAKGVTEVEVPEEALQHV